jgi:hypothetical protein
MQRPCRAVRERYKMDEVLRKEILALSRSAHALTETAYQQDSAQRGDAGWADKQRILLADMAMHLLQTALQSGDLSEDGLKRNLFSILTIADQFVQGRNLKAFAEELYTS